MLLMKGCGKELGYRHGSGVKAYCGDDVGTHIILCDKCKKKYSLNLNKESQDG